MKPVLFLCTLCGCLAFNLFLVADSFPAILGAAFAFSLTLSSVGTLLDAVSLLILKDPADYGKQRLWGALAWGLGLLCTEFLIEYTGTLNIIFVTFSVASFVQLALQLFLPVPQSAPEREPLLNNHLDGTGELTEEALADEILIQQNGQTLSQVLAKPKVVCFLTSITLLGMVFFIIQTYLFIFMAELGASFFLIGFATPISILLEVPAFYYASNVIKRLGVDWMLYISHLLLAARLIFYMLVKRNQAIFVLPIEALHGLAFALTWAAGMDIAQKSAPKTNKSTFISIYCTLFNNVGGIFGALCGGIIYERCGHQVLWAMCLGLVAVSMIFCKLKNYF